MSACTNSTANQIIYLIKKRRTAKRWMTKKAVRDEQRSVTVILSTTGISTATRNHEAKCRQQLGMVRCGAVCVCALSFDNNKLLKWELFKWKLFSSLWIHKLHLFTCCAVSFERTNSIRHKTDIVRIGKLVRC